MMEPKTYISQEKIARRVAELGQQISRDYQGQELTCVGILKGSVVFFADLIRELNLNVKLDFMSASSYGDQLESSGVVKINLDLSESIQGKNVLVVEDIVDTGMTIKYLMENLQTRHPKSLKICSLLSKPSRRKVEVPIDYLGFEIDDVFIVGYGLDASGKFRNLKDLAHV